MVMHEPWKASAPEVYLLTTTDGSVPRGLDPNRGARKWFARGCIFRGPTYFKFPKW